MDLIPEIPKEGKIVNIENDTTYYYRYQDLSWKWYDIVGNYSELSSEKPDGFSFQDKDTMIYTDWSEYSTDYPEEKSYREINQTIGYKFYYLNKSNEKVYYNNGKYTAREEVNTEKYDKNDNETYTLYHYRDKKWRWYNGQKRKYSSFSSKMPNGRPYKDAEIQNLNNPSSWESERHTDAATQEYRLEEKKLMTRFRTQYEILSLKVLPSPIERKEFEKKVNDSLINFAGRSDKKLETTYKFRYRKS